MTWQDISVRPYAEVATDPLGANQIRGSFQLLRSGSMKSACHVIAHSYADTLPVLESDAIT